MRKPLVKRLPSEFKNELGKYLAIFLLMVLSVSFVSGWNVAGGSMATAYDESFEKYSIEDGNFELYAKADDELIKAVEDSDKYNAKIYENFYVEFPTKEVDSTLRIFKKRTDINLECLMDGEFLCISKQLRTVVCRRLTLQLFFLTSQRKNNIINNGGVCENSVRYLILIKPKGKNDLVY